MLLVSVLPCEGRLLLSPCCVRVCLSTDPLPHQHFWAAHATGQIFTPNFSTLGGRAFLDDSCTSSPCRFAFWFSFLPKLRDSEYILHNWTSICKACSRIFSCFTTGRSDPGRVCWDGCACMQETTTNGVIHTDSSETLFLFRSRNYAQKSEKAQPPELVWTRLRQFNCNCHMIFMQGTFIDALSGSAKNICTFIFTLQREQNLWYSGVFFTCSHVRRKKNTAQQNKQWQ